MHNSAQPCWQESSSLFQNLGRNYSRLRFPSPAFLLIPALFASCIGQFKGYNPFHFLALSQFLECYALSRIFAASLIKYYICLSWDKLINDSYYGWHLLWPNRKLEIILQELHKHAILLSLLLCVSKVYQNEWNIHALMLSSCVPNSWTVHLTPKYKWVFEFTLN